MGEIARQFGIGYRQSMGSGVWTRASHRVSAQSLIISQNIGSPGFRYPYIDRRDDWMAMNWGGLSHQYGTLAQMQTMTRLLRALFGGYWIDSVAANSTDTSLGILAMLSARKLYVPLRTRNYAKHLIHVPLVKANGKVRCDVANHPRGLIILNRNAYLHCHCIA